MKTRHAGLCLKSSAMVISVIESVALFAQYLHLFSASLNRVPASAEVKAGKSPLLGGR